MGLCTENVAQDGMESTETDDVGTMLPVDGPTYESCTGGSRSAGLVGLSVSADLEARRAGASS